MTSERVREDGRPGAGGTTHDHNWPRSVIVNADNDPRRASFRQMRFCACADRRTWAQRPPNPPMALLRLTAELVALTPFYGFLLSASSKSILLVHHLRTDFCSIFLPPASASSPSIFLCRERIEMYGSNRGRPSIPPSLMPKLLLLQRHEQQ